MGPDKLAYGPKEVRDALSLRKLEEAAALWDNGDFPGKRLPTGTLVVDVVAFKQWWRETWNELSDGKEERPKDGQKQGLEHCGQIEAEREETTPEAKGWKRGAGIDLRLLRS